MRFEMQYLKLTSTRILSGNFYVIDVTNYSQWSESNKYMIGSDGTSISFSRDMAKYWCAGFNKKLQLSLESVYCNNVNKCVYVLAIPNFFLHFALLNHIRKSDAKY